MKAQISRIGTKVKEINLGSIVTINVRVIMFEMETTNMTTTSNMDNYGNKNDRNGPYVPPKNHEVTSTDG